MTYSGGGCFRWAGMNSVLTILRGQPPARFEIRWARNSLLTSYRGTRNEDDVFRNNLIAGAHTAAELNTLVIDRGAGDTTEKSSLQTNIGEIESDPVAAIGIAPRGVIRDQSTGGA